MVASNTGDALYNPAYDSAITGTAVVTFSNSILAGASGEKLGVIGGANGKEITDWLACLRIIGADFAVQLPRRQWQRRR